MTRVLVLGGDGMLGRMVAQVLGRSASIELAVSSRRPGATPSFDAEQGMDGLQRLVDTVGRCHVVVNCIGVLRGAIVPDEPASIERALRVNSLLPIHLARIATVQGMKVIHVSTDAVFSDTAGVCDEDTPADAPDAYGKSKYLGEVRSPHVINLRCSIVGPDPADRKGLLEWFLARTPGERVPGFADHRWNGITTLQFAQVCRQIVEQRAFDRIRSESPVHHLCAAAPVTKAQLLELFRDVFAVDAQVEAVDAPGGAVTRTLATRFSALQPFLPDRASIRQALVQLAAEIRTQPAHTS